MGCDCKKNVPAAPAATRLEVIVAEASNPGPLGVDTGVVFRSPRTGQQVRVIARVGERTTDAVARVKHRHGA